MRDPQDADVLNATNGSRWISRLPLAVFVAAVVVVIDQLTKWLALQNLEAGSCSQPDACIDLVAGVRLHLVYNNGAAFSSGADYGPIFGVLAFFMSFLLLYLGANQTRRRGLVPFAAIAGGAVGNLLDRAFRADDGFLTGAVIDFVDVGWWPVFNFADTAIVVGVAAVILFTALYPEDSTGDEPDPDDLDPADDTSAVDAGHRTGDEQDEEVHDGGTDVVDPALTSGMAGSASDGD